MMLYLQLALTANSTSMFSTIVRKSAPRELTFSKKKKGVKKHKMWNKLWSISVLIAKNKLTSKANTS